MRHRNPRRGDKNKEVMGVKVYIFVLRENISAVIIRFRLGFRPRPRWGSSQRSPDPLTGFDGVLLLREGKGMGWKGRNKGKYSRFPSM